MTIRTITFILLACFGLNSCSLSDQGILIVAVTTNQPSKVEELIASPHVDINSINDDIGPVLCIAAYTGHDEIIEILLKNRADINIRDERSSTPLMNAAAGDRESTVKLLLERGADPSLAILNKGEPTFMTALVIAKMRNNERIIALLEKAQH